ncbi:hypothetical protein RJ640_023679 [Escallonia rubra]|uniref:F-box domain-containing protein n=1 Tax=Escallonia rubra TaxID=112253 RepID=A0AA88RXA2_9ASTE|nr:hypothetical protein RJ640_023679 [Escallonia rubra]
MSDVPDDVMSDIFLRLPMETVLTCRSVSKEWYALLTSPNFLELHLHYRTSNAPEKLVSLLQPLGPVNAPVSLCIRDEEASVSIPLPFPFDRGAHIEIIGSCNGLVCAIICGSGGTGMTIVIWNPASTQYRFLETPQYGWQFDSFGHVGFGFLEDAHDYKIVMFLDGSSGGSTTILVSLYTLSLNTWKVVQVLVPVPNPSLVAGATFLNGFLHWMAAAQGNQIIVSFDLSNEAFGRIRCDPDAQEIVQFRAPGNTGKWFKIFHYVASLESVSRRFSSITGILEEASEGSASAGILEEAKEGNASAGLLEEAKEGNASAGLSEEAKEGSAGARLLEEAKEGEAPESHVDCKIEGPVPNSSHKSCCSVFGQKTEVGITLLKKHAAHRIRNFGLHTSFFRRIKKELRHLQDLKDKVLARKDQRTVPWTLIYNMMGPQGDWGNDHSMALCGSKLLLEVKNFNAIRGQLVLQLCRSRLILPVHEFQLIHCLVVSDTKGIQLCLCPTEPHPELCPFLAVVHFILMSEE